MGCVNGKQKSVRMGKQIKSNGQQPHIVDDQHFSSIAPYSQVCCRACGYDFGQGRLSRQIYYNKAQPSLQTSSTTPADQVISMLQQCNFYYQNHDIDSANDYLTQIESYRQKYPSGQLSHQIQRHVNRYSELLSKIKQQYEDVIQYENQILKGGWVEKSNRKGVKVSTRREEGTVGVLVQSVVEEPFQVLISFCIQMDLYKEFMPFMRVSREEKIVARNCRIGYTENNIPIVSVREAFFQGIGYNRLHKNNTLFLFTRSIHNRPDLQQKFNYKCNINENYVQLEYKYFVMWYEPLARGKGKITLAMNVDTKLNFIPLWIQDKISQDFGQQFFDNIIRLSKNFKNSQWEKNTSAKPELFLFFKNAIDNHLDEMENNGATHRKKRVSLQSSNESNGMERMI